MSLTGVAEFVGIYLTDLRGVYLPDLMAVNGSPRRTGKDYKRPFWDLRPVKKIRYSNSVYRSPWCVLSQERSATP